jgi:hypothetical protein
MANRLAIQFKAPGIWLDRAGNDLNERRLPGAILAHKGMYLTGPQLQGNILQRLNAAKRFRNLSKKEHGNNSHAERRGVEIW